jgi:hypothetical protein
MSYIIRKTDGTTLGTILDGTVDIASTSLTLVGRNYSNYGQIMTDNLVALVENFAYGSSPSNPLAGQIWWDTSLTRLKVYTGSLWKNISSATADTSAPAGAITGDLWWDTINDQLSGYNGSSWILIGPAYSKLNGKSGAIWETISDGSINHQVLSIYLNNARTSIISRDTVFTPSPAIPGYAVVQQGLTANTSINSGTFYVTANNANYLGGVVAANYLRTDIDNTSIGSLTINNDNGIVVGSGSDLAITVAGTDVAITNQSSDGDISVYANVGGVLTRSIYVNGLTGAVEVSDDPTTATGIATKQYVDDSFTDSNLLGTPTAPTATTGTNTTQLATTAFVQNSISLYKIYGNDSYIQVTDTGAGPGSIEAVIDGVQVLTGSASGISLKNGATAIQQPQIYNEAGNASVATTSYVKSATQWWGGSAKFVSTSAPLAGVNDSGSNDGDFWFQYS